MKTLFQSEIDSLDAPLFVKKAMSQYLDLHSVRDARFLFARIHSALEGFFDLGEVNGYTYEAALVLTTRLHAFAISDIRANWGL